MQSQLTILFNYLLFISASSPLSCLWLSIFDIVGRGKRDGREILRERLACWSWKSHRIACFRGKILVLALEAGLVLQYLYLPYQLRRLVDDSISSKVIRKLYSEEGLGWYWANANSLYQGRAEETWNLMESCFYKKIVLQSPAWLWETVRRNTGVAPWTVVICLLSWQIWRQAMNRKQIIDILTRYTVP